MHTQNSLLDESGIERYLSDLGPLPKPAIRRAHDVRHLVVCAHCRDLTDDRHCLHLFGKPYHGRCFLKQFGMRALLATPARERAGLQLGDIGLLAARALIEADEAAERR